MITDRVTEVLHRKWSRLVNAAIPSGRVLHKARSRCNAGELYGFVLPRTNFRQGPQDSGMPRTTYICFYGWQHTFVTPALSFFSAYFLRRAPIFATLLGALHESTIDCAVGRNISLKHVQVYARTRHDCEVVLLFIYLFIYSFIGASSIAQVGIIVRGWKEINKIKALHTRKKWNAFDQQCVRIHE